LGRLATILAASAFVLLLAGCGSSSSEPWTVVDTGHSTGGGPGRAGGTVGRPAIVEVQVESKPNVTAKVSYTIACGPANFDSVQRKGPVGRTPLTTQVPIPEGEPGACIVNVLAAKEAPADMTVTLRMRSVGT
jgi:hypothetical protein